MKFIFNIAMIVSMGLLFSSNAYAYLDAGSGGLLLQLALGGIAGGLAIVKLYWNQIKEKVMGVKKETIQAEEMASEDAENEKKAKGESNGDS